MSQNDRFEVVRHCAALASDLRDGLLFDRQYLCMSVKPMPAKARDLSVADCAKDCGVAAALQPAVRSPAAAVATRVLRLCVTPL